MREEQAIFNLEIRKKSGLSILKFPALIIFILFPGVERFV